MREQAIAAIDIGLAERLAIDGDQPLRVFPCRLRHQLLQPRTETGNPWRRDDRHLVTAEFLRRNAEDSAKHETGILCSRNGRHAGAHHLLRPVEELRHIHAHDRRGDQAKIRENRVAAADARPAKEDSPKAVTLGNLFHLRARICDREKAAADLLRADDLFDTGEKVLLENIGFERRARLARHDHERVLQIDFVLDGFHLSRIGGIEHVKLREPADLTEGLLDNLRTEARSPHSQQQDMGEAGSPRGVSDTGQALDVSQLTIRNAEPSEPLRFIPAAPE